VTKTDYKIALSPDVGIDAYDFVTAWNNKPQTLDVAKAEAVEISAEDFILIDPNMLEEGLIYLAGVGSTIVVGILKDLIKDLIKDITKQKLNNRRKTSDFLVVVVDHVDTPIIVVKEQGK